MILITGDTHGRRNIFENKLVNSLSKDYYIIITGDFGFIFNDKIIENEEKLLSEMESKIRGHVLFIDGNHENFERLYAYPERICWGGRVHVIRENIYHLMRGQVYCIPADTHKEYNIFTMGGGYTIDQTLHEENLWWSAELPTESEYVEALLNLNKHLNSVDYIVSHTCPTSTVIKMGHNPSPHERILNDFLQYISKKVVYRHWYFGHWHKDYHNVCNNRSCIYKDIYNLVTDELVYKH